jgi:mannose-6-phosphate isomerase
LQVRAGLTPKFKDVDILVEMLTYSMGGPSIDAGAYDPDHPHIIRYTPPVPEFEVLLVTVDPAKTVVLPSSGEPAILIVLEGAGVLEGMNLRPGQAYYWPKDAGELSLAVNESRRGPLKVAIAHKNCHLMNPTTVNRDNFGSSSHHGSSHRLYGPSSPMPYQGLGEKSPSSYLQVTTTPELFDQMLPNLNDF